MIPCSKCILSLLRKIYIMHKNLLYFFLIYLAIPLSLLPSSEEFYPKSSIEVCLPKKETLENNLKRIGYTDLVEHSNLVEKLYEKKLSPLQFATVVRQAYFQHDEHFNQTLYTPEEKRLRNNNRNYLFYVLLGPSDALGELYSLGLYKPIIFK